MLLKVHQVLQEGRRVSLPAAGSGTKANLSSSFLPAQVSKMVIESDNLEQIIR